MSRAAIPLVAGFSVMGEVQDGGHSPIVVRLRPRAVRLDWKAPRPQLPEMLHAPAKELQADEAFLKVVGDWKETEEFERLKSAEKEALGSAVFGALEKLVEMAGGRQARTKKPRRAYESRKVLCLRQDVNALNATEVELERWGRGTPGGGGRGIVLDRMPYGVEVRLKRLTERGICVRREGREILLEEVRKTRASKLELLKKEMQRMRYQRAKRWKDALPRVWQKSPGAIYGWLRDEKTSWGQAPLLGSDGKQLTSVGKVDAAVKEFWVEKVWRKEKPDEAEASWNTFQASEFAPFVGNVGRGWPEPRWTGELVKEVLRSMKQKAAPGMVGVPVGVWLALPSEWHDAVARLLEHILTGGEWPEQAVEAYVSLIPKGLGTEVTMQRPITVLELIFRIFATGVVKAWRPVLHEEHLGDQAMGFRAGSGTRHVGQFLTDVVAMRQMQGREVWLVKFDVKKCYDSIPWWALFGVMERSGVSRRVVRAFRRFYEGLIRRFRYGAVDGSPWKGTNGMAQGCPAAPDMLNVLFEPFHRWAVAQGRGIALLGGGAASSGSYADDVVLVAGSKADAEFLIAGYLRWCELLHLTVDPKKTQAWCSVQKKGEKVRVGTEMVDLSDEFKFVGMVIAAKTEMEATKLHLEGRVEKAVMSARRIEALGVPLWMKAHLWRSVVLPQALYGCEIRNVSSKPKELGKLLTVGRRIVRRALELVEKWSAPELVLSRALGGMACRDPMLEARSRQLRWLMEMANGTDVVGRLHRALAIGTEDGAVWKEPCEALKVALADAGWNVVVNWRAKGVVRAQWPVVVQEPPPLRAEVVLAPRDGPLVEGAWFTDGSVGSRGGAGAAVEVDGGKQVVSRYLRSPRSSTEPELIGIRLAAFQGAQGVYTDSLAALTTLAGWAMWKKSRRLKCEDRGEVRAILWKASEGGLRLLEKVKAHRKDEAAKSDPKAIWNEKADEAAGRTASGGGGVGAMEPEGLEEFQDVVRFQHRDGRFVSIVGKLWEEEWWEKQRVEVMKRRQDTLGRVYPAGMEMWWKVSTKMFVRPSLRGGVWINKAPPGLVKWVARARTGALATMERMTRTGYVKGPDGTPGDPKCECCGAPVENDEHVLTGCPETGTDKVVAQARDTWRRILDKSLRKGVKEAAGVVDPPEAWFEKFKMQWAVGLIPLEARMMLPVQDSLAERWMAEMSMLMSEWLQERVRVREGLLDAAAARRGGDRKAEIKSMSKKKASHVPHVGVGRFGLTEAEVRELARGEVEVRWSDARTKMSEKDQRAKRERLDMKDWIKSHFSPEQMVDAKDDADAASVHSLVVLWEVENGPYPCGSKCFMGVMTKFTRDLKSALAGMESPYRDVKSARVRRLIAAGAGSIWLHNRFGLKLENPPPEFLEKWKDFLRWVAKGRMQGTHGAGGSVRAQQWEGHQRGRGGARRGRGRGGRRGRGRPTGAVILDDDGDDDDEGDESVGDSDVQESGVGSSEEDQDTSEEDAASESAEEREAEGEDEAEVERRVSPVSSRGTGTFPRGGGRRGRAGAKPRGGRAQSVAKEGKALKQGRGTKRKRDIAGPVGGEDRDMPSDGGDDHGSPHGGSTDLTAGSVAGHGRASTGASVPTGDGILGS